MRSARKRKSKWYRVHAGLYVFSIGKTDRFKIQKDDTSGGYTLIETATDRRSYSWTVKGAKTEAEKWMKEQAEKWNAEHGQT